MKSKEFKLKKICIVSDCYIPTQNSAAGMIYNLSLFLKELDFKVLCIHGGKNPKLNQSFFLNYNIKQIEFITSNFLVFLRNKGNISRLFYEIVLSLILSFKVIINFKKFNSIDFILWYGPSSFLWLPALCVKLISKGRLVYILRDIFPDWLISVGIIKNRLVYNILSLLSKPQYIIPEVIFVESKENIELLSKKTTSKLDVLYNWPSLSKPKIEKTKEQILKYIKSNKKIKIHVIYSGNIGIAQDTQSVFKFLNQLLLPKHIQISLFIPKSKNISNKYNSANSSIKVFDGVSDIFLFNILKFQNYGIVSLNPRLISNNIPGKFVSYTQFSLPVLFFGHSKSTLAKLIINYNCGVVIDLNLKEDKNIENCIKFFQMNKKEYIKISKNSHKVFKKYFDLINLKNKIFNLDKKFHGK